MKPSALILVLSYLKEDSGLQLDSLTQYQARNVLVVANALKLIELQIKLLRDVVSKLLHKENVVSFLNYSYQVISKIKFPYMEENFSDEDLDADEEIDQNNSNDQEREGEQLNLVCLDDYDLLEEV